MQSYAEIYVLDKFTLDQLGQVSEYKGLVFPKQFIGCSKFELYTPITENNIDLLQEGRLIYLNEDYVGEILRKQTIINDAGEKVFKISGLSLEHILKSRIIWGTYHGTKKRPDEMILEVIEQNCINPTDKKRVIPFLKLGSINSSYQLPAVSHQKTGDEVYEFVKTMCETYSFGFGAKLKLKEKKIIVFPQYGYDKTISQSDRDYVLLSTDMQDITKSEYTKDVSDVKTTALVAGEGENEERISVVAGDSSISGFERKELYVDARDIQSKDTDVSINVVLTNRGLEKLSECIISEVFEFDIRPEGNSFELGTDYFLGDTITVIDEEIGVQADVVVTEVGYEWDGDKFSLRHAFGFKSLKMMDKVKRMVK